MANETAELEAMKSGELGAAQSDDCEPGQRALFAEELDDAARNRSAMRPRGAGLADRPARGTAPRLRQFV